MARLRTHNRRARLCARMAPWLARLEPKAAGTRPDLAAAVRRVLRARAPEGGPLRLAWLRALAVPFVGPHEGETTLILEQPRGGRRARRWHVGPDGVAWWLLPPPDLSKGQNGRIETGETQCA